MGTKAHWKQGAVLSVCLRALRVLRGKGLFCALGPGKTLIKSLGFEGDGLQAVRKCRSIVAALAAEGAQLDFIRLSPGWVSPLQSDL